MKNLGGAKYVGNLEVSGNNAIWSIHVYHRELRSDQWLEAYISVVIPKREQFMRFTKTTTLDVLDMLDVYALIAVINYKIGKMLK